MKNWLVKFIRLKMWILHAKLLIKHFGRFDQDIYAKFHPNILDIVTMGYGPNIHMELHYTFIQEFV